MPDKSPLDFVFQHTLYYQVGPFVLLIAAYHLDALTLLVGGIGCEVIEYIEQCLGREQLFHLYRYVVQSHQSGHIISVIHSPCRPEFQRRTYGTIVQFLPFGREAQYVGYKEFGHTVFIPVVNIGCGIEPRNRWTNGCLGLAHYQGNTIDKHHDVGAFGFPVADAELIDQLELVVLDGFKVYQLHRHMRIVLSKRHGLVPFEPFGKLLIGTHQSRTVYRQQNRPQFIDHFVGSFGLCCNLRIQLDKSLLQLCFYQHFRDFTRQLRSWSVYPLCTV